jgi:hypothetical protein
MSFEPLMFTFAVPGHGTPPADAVRNPPAGEGPDSAVTTRATDDTPEPGMPPRPRTGTFTFGYGVAGERT